MGLGRGVGIHEIALYNTSNKEINQFVIEPNLTVVKPGKRDQDILRLATSASDVHQAHPGLQQLIARGEATWKDSLVAQVLMAKGSEEGRTRGLTVKEIRSMSLADLQSELSAREPIIHKWLQEGKYPWLADLEGKVRDQALSDEAIKQRMKKAGSDVRVATAQNISIDQIFDPEGAFLRKAKGNAIWIANANFESKQIGAKLAALEQGARDEFFGQKISQSEYIQKIKKVSGFRNVIAETSLSTSDVLAVTGKEVNRARAAALITGDWTGVFEAYLKNTGKGDVRDIIDVVKAQQSHSQGLGIMKGKSPFSLGMDVQARLYGYSIAKTKEEAWKALTSKEVHAAFMDAGVTENLVLKQSLRQTSALREVASGSKEGLRLLQQAQEGKGAFHAALRYASAAEEIGKVTQKAELQKRFSRAWLDITKEGVTHQSNGYRLGQVKRIDPQGVPRSVPIAIPMRTPFTNIGEVVEHVKSQGKYALVDVAKVASDMEEDFVRKGFLDANSRTHNPVNSREFTNALTSLVNSGSEYLDDHFSKVANTVSGQSKAKMFSDMEAAAESGGRIVGGDKAKWAGWKAMDVKAGRVFRYAGMFAGGVTLLGALAGHKHDVRRQRQGPETFRTMNYERWLEGQAEFSSMEMPHKGESGFLDNGLNAQRRKSMTDFGSPYRGPIASTFIFEHQDMLAEREKYIREVYNVNHFDENSSIGQYWKKFRLAPGGDARSVGASIRDMVRSSSVHYTRYQQAEGTNYVDLAGYEGMAKGNLLKVNINNYKLSAEDADTIVLKQKGTNALSDFFGLNESIKIRMAGIDAPETAHAGRSAMPYADNATAALRSMLNGGDNIELLIDPKNQTYGRSVGFVFADGVNLNLELLRRGSASYLPFRKKGSKEMYNSQIFSRTAALAQGSERNMWGMPMYKAYADVVAASGSTITFNTLVNPSSVAKNANLMSTRALMWSAQEQGFYNNAMATEAASIGERYSEMGFDADYKAPKLFNWSNTPHKDYMNQLLFEGGELMATKGGRHKYKLSHRMGYGSLDKALTLDTLGTSTSIWNKRTPAAYSMYQSNHRRRREEMAQLQRHQNHQMFNSPINHHRM